MSFGSCGRHLVLCYASFVLVSFLPPSLTDVPGVEPEGGAFFQAVVQHAC